MKNKYRIAGIDNPLITLLSGNSQEVLIILDDHYEVLLFNSVAGTLFSCHEEEIPGLSFEALCVRVQMNSFTPKEWTTIFTHSNSVTTTLSLFNLKLDWVIQPLKFNDAPVIVLHSINYREREKEKMQRVVQETKAEFIKNMSHDLRAPLTGIMGLSKRLEKKPNHSEIQQYARIIHNSCQQLLNLLDDMTDVAAAGNPIYKGIPCLLLVEDNPIARRVIEMAASDAGCHFVSAENAETAFELLQSSPFDLIVTDIGLPGMSGTELTHSIRKWEQTCNKKPLPIIGFTTCTEETEQAEFIRSGMNSVLAKPANPAKIKQVIETFL